MARQGPVPVSVGFLGAFCLHLVGSADIDSCRCRGPVVHVYAQILSLRAPQDYSVQLETNAHQSLPSDSVLDPCRQDFAFPWYLPGALTQFFVLTSWAEKLVFADVHWLLLMSQMLLLKFRTLRQSVLVPEQNTNSWAKFPVALIPVLIKEKHKAQQLRELAASRGPGSLSLAPTRWLTTSSNSSCRGPVPSSDFLRVSAYVWCMHTPSKIFF